MATTLKLPYVRYVRQVQSAPGALPQFVAMMNDNFERLKDASWIQATASASDIAMPANDPLTFAPSTAYDAYKMSSTTAASGIETAYAGMAAYRFAIPADAISGSKYIRGLTVTLGADKFAYSGIKVAIHATNTSTPTTDWDFIRTGGYGSTLDVAKEFATYDADPEVYGVLTGHVATVSTATNQAAAYTFDLSGLGNTNYSYLFVYITMFNYTDYRANRQYWVEGSGIVNGATAEVTFASDTTADADTSWSGWYIAEGKGVDTGGIAQDLCLQVTATDTNFNQPQVASGFPLMGTTTQSYVAGATGFTVGFDTGGKVQGAFLGRWIMAPSGKTLTRLRFSGSSVLALASKQFACRLAFWSGSLATPLVTNDKPMTSVPKLDTTGLHQHALFLGNSGASIVTTYSSDTASPGSWTLAGIGTQEIIRSDVLLDTEFSISLSGQAAPTLVAVTLMPLVYWGTIGSNTKATFTPGTYLYLK